MKNYFGMNLRYLRKKNCMTQDDLAAKLTVSRQTVSNYERGNRFCDLNTLVLVSDLFGISIDDLLKKPIR